MNRSQWLEAARAILAQAATLLRPWGVDVDPELSVREDTHPCPGFVVGEKCIEFCPPVAETRLEKMRWLMHRRIMGCETLLEAEEFYANALPYIICHELSHGLRFRHGLASPSMFVEEQVCDHLAVSMLEARNDWRATLEPLRTACKRMAARLAGDSNLEHAYLPSAADVLVNRKSMSRAELDELESLAAESGLSADELLRMAGGDQRRAVAEAGSSRSRAEEYIDSRYTDNPQTYWLLKLVWLDAWLERAARPDLPSTLREHILRPKETGENIEVAAALQGVMRSDNTALALLPPPATSMRAAAAEGYLAIVGEAGLAELVETALACGEPEQFARAVLNARCATPANRTVLLPLALACMHAPAAAPGKRLAAGALLALGIGEPGLLAALKERAAADEALAAILLANRQDLEREPIPHAQTAREHFLAAWRLAGRKWHEIPRAWRQPLLRENTPLARQEVLSLAAASDEAVPEAVFAAIAAKLENKADDEANQILSRDRAATLAALLQRLPERGSDAWETALRLLKEFEFDPAQGSLPLLASAAGSDISGCPCTDNAVISAHAGAEIAAGSRLLWAARQFVVGTAEFGVNALAQEALMEFARAKTVNLVATISPLNHARVVRRIEQSSARRELSGSAKDIIAGMLPMPWQSHVRWLLAGQGGDVPPDSGDLPEILLWILAAVRPKASGKLKAWLDTLQLPEAATVLNSVERMVHLRSVPLFEGLGAESLRALAEHALEQRFEPGETIVTEGEPGDRMYIVLTGQVEARQQNAQGPFVLGTMGPRQVFGEMTLLDGSPRSATVVAISRCRLLTLSRSDLRPVARRNPEIYEELLIALSEKLRAANTRNASR